MKLIIIKSNLRDGLVATQGVAGEKQDLPILKNVLIEAIGNKIRLTTTNLELALTCVVLGKVIESGSITAPVGVLSSLIGNIQSERLNIELHGKKLEIKTDNYEASVQTLSPEEFPIIPKIKTTKGALGIDGRVLKEALAQVIGSAQSSELRPELNAVSFVFSLDHLKLAATDSFRLAEKTITKSSLKISSEENTFKIIVPLKTTQELLRIVQDDDQVELLHDENQVLFRCERFELISRLTEGNFPDYEYLIPKKFEAETVVSRDEFLAALKLASVFSSRVSEVRLRTVDKKAIEITSTDQAIGENKYLLPGKIIGAPREISFNWRYITDGLKNLKSEDVFFGLNEDNKPALMRSPNDPSYFYILMPILRA